MSSGFNTIIKYNGETKTVDYEEAVKAVREAPNPIAAILEMLDMKNVSVKKVPKEVEEMEFTLPSSVKTRGARRSDEEWKTVAKSFLDHVDAGKSQADAARAADPSSNGVTQTIRKKAQSFFPTHKLFRTASAPKTPPKK